MTTKKDSRARPATSRPRGAHVSQRAAPLAPPVDWAPIADAALVGAEWVLDRAAEIAADYTEEAAAVERVRAFVHAQLAGVDAPLAIEDLLFVMGLVIERLGRDLGIDDPATAMVDPFIATFGGARDELAALRLELRMRPLVRHCPGAPSARRVRDLYIHAAA